MNLLEYDTYEERENAFRRSVFQLIPRKYSGPTVFWSDFSQITASLPSLSPLLQGISYITGNPRDCLALGTPGQILTAAVLRCRRQDPRFFETPESVAGIFELQDQFQQPVRSLSGGEAVKLALAKAFVSEPCSFRLAASSPYSWLSRSNRKLFDMVLDRFRNAGKEVDVFVLNGEYLAESGISGGSEKSKVDFRLSFEKVRLELGDPLSMETDDRVHVFVADGRYDLWSPCLIHGENGQGKSLIAKILSGAVGYRGRAWIDGGQNPGSPARLLFQDMTTQTLLRSFHQIIAFSDWNGSCAVEIYREILRSAVQWFQERETPAPVSPETIPSDWCSLLELKICLVACRVACLPSAVILDEPDWGLSRMASAAFVCGVVAAAHRRGIPVILITHKPWWDRIAGSVLLAVKGGKGINGRGNPEFRIDLVSQAIPSAGEMVI